MGESEMTKKQTIKKWWGLHLALIIIIGIIYATLSLSKSVTVVATAMNVRTGPGVEYDIAAQVKKGQKLRVLEEDSEWLHVKTEKGKSGWVASWLVEKEEATPATNIPAFINTNKTKLREFPDQESKEIAQLKKKTEVTITMEQNGWSQITVGDKKGWVFSDLITLATNSNKEPATEKIKQLYARQNETKLRQSPSIESDIIGTVDRGETLKVLSIEDDWYQVETKNNQTGYVANWVVATAKPSKKQDSVNSSIAETTIVLDPGHGGTDVGAQSNDGKIFEKNVTLATAKYVQKALLDLGANVILTHQGDELLGLSEIAEKSNRANADVFISFHYDSTEDSNEASGTTTYYYDEKNLPLANAVENELAKNLPLISRGVEFGDYQVLRENNQPALLLELGYMNNDNDLAQFKTKKYQELVAKAVQNALLEYFK